MTQSRSSFLSKSSVAYSLKPTELHNEDLWELPSADYNSDINTLLRNSAVNFAPLSPVAMNFYGCLQPDPLNEGGITSRIPQICRGTSVRWYITVSRVQCAANFFPSFLPSFRWRSRRPRAPPFREINPPNCRQL